MCVGSSGYSEAQQLLKPEAAASGFICLFLNIADFLKFQ